MALRKRVTSVFSWVTLVGLVAVFVWAHNVGLTLNPILSGSMEPAIQTGSLAVVTPVSKKDVKEGMVVAYRPEGENISIAHRVIKVEEKPDGTKRITTKGDHNNAPDGRTYALPPNGVSEVRTSIPLAGYAYSFLMSKNGRSIAIGAGLFLVMLALISLFMFDEKKDDEETVYDADIEGACGVDEGKGHGGHKSDSENPDNSDANLAVNVTDIATAKDGALVEKRPVLTRDWKEED